MSLDGIRCQTFRRSEGSGWLILNLVLAASTFLCPVLIGQEVASTRELSRPLSFSFSEMFTFFFLMLGPLKFLGPFVQMTPEGDAKFGRRLAFRAFGFSCVALLFAAIAGENSLRKYRIPVAVLAIAAGIILFLVALRTVMQQFDLSTETAPVHYESNLRLAFFPLSFPTIVTPYGIAAVIVCMALTPDYLVKSEIYGALFGLMLINLVAMLLAKPILKYLGTIMLLVGTVLAIIQVALGLTIIFKGLHALG